MNFARRQECNKCGAPKPGDGGFGGGGECFRDVLLPEMFTGLENGPCSFSEKKPGSRNMFLSMAKLAKFLFFIIFFFLSLSSHPLSKSLLLNFYVNTFSNGLKAFG